jgi:hypothetical protein
LQSVLVALDISTHTGWGVLRKGDSGQVEVLAWGRVDLVRFRGEYPWNYVEDAQNMARNLVGLLDGIGVQHPISEVVIEETNGSKNRYSQKLLEFLHLAFLQRLRSSIPKMSVRYISTGTWRKYSGIVMSKEDKKKNAALSRAKKKGDEKAAKKRLGVRGKTKIKHVAVRWANETYRLHLKAGDHDIAEALALGTARLLGAPLADGEMSRKKDKTKE